MLLPQQQSGLMNLKNSGKTNVLNFARHRMFKTFTFYSRKDHHAESIRKFTFQGIFDILLENELRGAGGDWGETKDLRATTSNKIPVHNYFAFYHFVAGPNTSRA